ACQKGSGTCGGRQSHGGPRTGPEFHAIGSVSIVGGIDDACDVVGDDIRQMNGAGNVAELDQFLSAHHMFNGRLDADLPVLDDLLENGDGISSDFEFKQKAIQLCFWQWIGSFEFDRVLGGENEKGL